MAGEEGCAMNAGKFSYRPGDGLYYGASDEDPTSGEKVCGPLWIEGLVRDGDSMGWGKLFVWFDADGNRHEWAMKMSALLPDGREVIAHLADGGLDILDPKLLVQFARFATSDVRVRRVLRTGWHEEGNRHCFVFADATVGEVGAAVSLATATGSADAGYAVSGTLTDWQREVAARCPGNSRLVLAVSAGFAAMLLHPLGLENGGVHLVGPSSSGKTTALRVAASVFGGERYVQRWRATDNGLEGVAALHNDALLVLDELAQADPRRLGDVAYMLANGQGKVRADRTGEARARKSWRLLFLSSGETTLAQHMAVGGMRVRAGQEVRFVDLPADAGKGLGLFESLHDATSPAEFARCLSTAAMRHYGAAAREFAAKCIEHRDDLLDLLSPQIESIADSLVRDSGLPADDVGGQVTRVAARFALIAAAGEFATSLDVTGWELGEAERAVRSCMRDWLEARGTAHNSEPEAMLQAVRAFLTRHGESRFTDMDARAEDEEEGRRTRATYNRAGWRRTYAGRTEFLIDPDVFRAEVCAGFEPVQVCRALADKGCLSCGPEAGKMRYTLHRTTPESAKSRRYYVVTDAIWEE
jgi:putative DNA primase/helicase